MGKSTRSRKSVESTNANKSKHKISGPLTFQKIQQGKKKRFRQINTNLQKIMQQYNNTQSQTSMSSDSTIISLDSSTPGRKRKNSSASLGHNMKRKKRYFSNNSLIVVPTDSPPTNEPTTKSSGDPVHCSTPKSSQEPEYIPLFQNKTNNNSNKTLNFNGTVNATKVINDNSFLTIDLTTETLNCSSISKVDNTMNTVIDLDNSLDNTDCAIVSVSNANLSLSGESDVTVVNMTKSKTKGSFDTYAKGIAKMNSSEKGRLLDLITQNIFCGCHVTSNLANPGSSGKKKDSVTTETVEDTYIKEVIVNQTQSRNSIGSNIYNPERDEKHKTGLRMVVIDGSNVAMQHGRGKSFSVKGLKICIDYFLKRGHAVKAFVPRFRCKFGKSSDPRMLDDLERRGLVVYTPSREVQGRMITSYDDRYIVQCAAEFDGVIVSGDNYRDLLQENPRWRFVIENRLLPFTWVNDMIMFPKDPLGRQGPTLEQFLKHSTPSHTITSSKT